MENVIREDVIKLSIDTDLKALTELQDEINDLKKKLTGDMGSDALDDLKESTEDAIKPVKNLKEQAKEVVERVTEIGKKAATSAFNGLKKVVGVSFNALKNAIKTTSTKLTELGKKAATSAYNGLKKVAGISFKALTAGLGSAATGLGVVIGKSLNLAGELEQNIGGAESVFGDLGDTISEMTAVFHSYDSATGKTKKTTESLEKISADAYKTMGLSQSDYLATVNKMGSLMQGSGLDAQTSLSLSSEAMQRAADVASIMGVDVDMAMESIAGAAKGNFTMMDNLGVKMDATTIEAYALSKGIKTAYAKMDNATKVQLAMQMFLEKTAYATGNYAKENDTYAGSLQTVKGAWTNLLGALATGENLDIHIENMVGSVEAFGKKAIPMAEKALAGIGTVIEKLAPIIADKLPDLVEKLLPPLIKAAVKLISGLIKSLPSIVKTVINELPFVVKEIGTAIAEAFGTKFPALENFGNAIKDNAQRIAKYVGYIIAAFAGLKVLTKIVPLVTGIFGKSKGGGENNFLANLGKQFANLGNINTGKIALGLANLAIIIGGISVLTIAVAGAMWLLKKFSSPKEILQMVGLIGALGAVGMALAFFAGIIGAIPIPVVLLGLANLALVLGGITLLIEAFGLLTKIPGFTEFLEIGGQVLVQICNILGEMVGALAGGLIEGLSSALPTLGENLGKFGENIKPLFTAMSGVDMGGVASFFVALVGLLAIATGNEIINGIKAFFGGGESSLAKLGTQLSDFATNAQGFFATVSTLPENGFTNATKLFECLGGVKSLPKKGGVVGWFTGNINYTSLANGLGQLASEKVTGFFTAVSGLKQNGFDSAAKLFECLANMKSLPKEGGVVGWFSGSVNYANIAKGLGQLSSDGVMNFFTKLGGVKKSAFENVKLFFESLSGIGDLPSEGGWWQKITGDKSTALSNIATEIENFSTKSESFFKQINSLNLGNLNGLWKSLSKAETVTADVSKVIDDKISEIVKKVSTLPEKMGDGLRQGGKSLSQALVDVWTDAVKESVKPVNKVLDAANWILKEFGSDKRVISWTPYAKGTGGHRGGNAMVNDGRGAELVQMPNGRMFIPNGRNVFLPNAPKGMKVLPAEQTARLMGRGKPTYRYANGTGEIDLWSYIDNASGLTSKIANSVSYSGMSAFASNVGKGMVSTFTGEMTGWVEKLFEEEGILSLASYNASKGVEQWRSTVIRALKMEGQYSAANVKRTLYQMQTESGGNPKAINLWDSNAKKGIPSKGLMQVIDPTFRAYARSGYNKNIYDPLSNILASVRYATSRYGSLSKAYRGVGYSKGVGEVTLPHSSGVRMSYTPESDASIHASSYTEYNTYSPSFTINIEGTSDDRAMARKVKQWVSEAMNDAFKSMERKTVRLQEV